MKDGFNYKYNNQSARAKITEMISKVQNEIAKQEDFCDHDRSMIEREGFPTDSFDIEYERLTKLYYDLDKILDDFR